MELWRNFFRKLFYCGVEGILTHAKQNTSIFEGILTPDGISTHAKEYAGTFEGILTPEGILTHTKEYGASGICGHITTFL